MKTGNCKLWHVDGVKDKKKQYKLFGKCLGFCRCSYGRNYPMFNSENCPKIKEKKDESI